MNFKCRSDASLIIKIKNLLYYPKCLSKWLQLPLFSVGTVKRLVNRSCYIYWLKSLMVKYAYNIHKFYMISCHINKLKKCTYVFCCVARSNCGR